jgi:hypothetical protein
MKNGGADITILDGTPLQDHMLDMRGDLLQVARQIAEDGEIAAFVCIALRHDGTDISAYRTSDGCPVPRMLMPSLVAELVRANMIGSPLAEQTFGEMFEWVE